MPRDPAPSPLRPVHATLEALGAAVLPAQRGLWRWLILSVPFGFGLLLLARINYLLFHVLIELFSVILATAVFTIGWNARHMARSPFFLILATGFLATGCLDLLHTFTYKGMGIFPAIGSNITIQLWIAARMMETASFFTAACTIGRAPRLSPAIWLIAFLGGALVLGLAVWPLQIFPSCYVEGTGLTPLKIFCEYLIAAVLAVSILLFRRHREVLGPHLVKVLTAALLFNIASELSLTLYVDLYGATNFVGHLLKLVTIVLVYHALVEGTLRTPYGTLFRELTALNRDLDAELRLRQESERQLRAANREFATLYRSSQALHSTLQLDALTHLVLSMAVAAEGGGFRRAMVFVSNPRTGVLQGMLGVDQESAAAVFGGGASDESWRPPRLDAAACRAQREAAFNQAVVKQRLSLVAGDNALAQACLEQRLTVVTDPEAEPPGGCFLARDLGLASYACAPLSIRDEPFGVLVVDLAGEEQVSSPERLRFLELYARQASAALENARLLHRLEGAHSELRAVQEQLIQGEKMAVLGEMAAQVAHELRNPLVSVGGFAQRLAKLDIGNERASEYAAIIAREVRRLEEMLGNILAFSRKQLICLEPCSLNEVVADALELETELRQAAGIALQLEVVAPLPEVVGDCRQLRQVILNLLANARQAMPRGGTLTVRADMCMLRGEEAVAVEVEDTGGGVPPEIIRNIFNPFFSTHPKGTGIGLSISHRIIEQHHGEIEVFNGEAGACFIVRIPLKPPHIAIR